jgi:hypothetical protein
MKDKKTVISASLPTPQWAKWVFRVFITITTAACFIVVSDPAIAPETANRISLYLKTADMVVLGLANMLGIKTDEKNG